MAVGHKARHVQSPPRKDDPPQVEEISHIANPVARFAPESSKKNA
jgi:hypothetical protein